MLSIFTEEIKKILVEKGFNDDIERILSV